MLPIIFKELLNVLLLNTNVGVTGQVTGHVIRNGDKPVNAIIYTMTSAKSTDIEAKRGIAPNDVIANFGQVNLVVFARVVLIFNA